MTKESWESSLCNYNPALTGHDSKDGLRGCPASLDAQSHPPASGPSSPWVPAPFNVMLSRRENRHAPFALTLLTIFSARSRLFLWSPEGQVNWAQHPTTDMRHGPNETHGNRQHDPASSRWADCHVSFRSMVPLHASSPPPRLVPSAVGSPSSGPWPMADGRCNGLMLALHSPPRRAPLRLGSAHPNTWDGAR